MARSSNKDPLSKFRWAVTIYDSSGNSTSNRAGFSSCETPSLSINTKSYAEGGNHLWPKKIIDSIEYKPIVLQRGVTSNSDFDLWAKQAFELFQNRNYKDQNTTAGYRRTVILDHLDRAGRIVKSYKLYNCFPIEYKPASDFAADGDDLMSMERLVLAYESFEVQGNPNSTDTNPVDPRDFIKRLTNRLF